MGLPVQPKPYYNSYKRILTRPIAVAMWSTAVTDGPIRVQAQPGVSGRCR